MQVGKKQHSNTTLKIRRNGKKITLNLAIKLMVLHILEANTTEETHGERKRNCISQPRNQINKPQQHRVASMG